MQDRNRICPVELAGSLDNRLRRWFQNPRKILAPHVRDEMTVMDIGCGPGFFTLEMARMVGNSGRVIACDLQEGMLEKLRSKVRGSELEGRIVPHLCQSGRLGVTEAVDFALAFYMIHEVPDKDGLFAEVYSVLKPKGRFLVVEPPFHVSKAEFEETVRKVLHAGFEMMSRPKVTFSRTALFGKKNEHPVLSV